MNKNSEEQLRSWNDTGILRHGGGHAGKGGRRAAFTLAEMMVVMLVLTIIMAAFAPLMTKRKATDTATSPWKYASNNSDIYYGLASEQTAMIGQKEKDSSDSARFLIKPGSDTQAHILLKDTSGTNLGKIYMLGTNLQVGGFPEHYFSAYSSRTYGNTYIGSNAGNSAAHIGTYGNTAIGAEALPNYRYIYSNTVIGYQALSREDSATENSNTLRYNTVIGNQAMYGAADQETVPQSNTVVGYQAGYTLDGKSNTLIGALAGYELSGDSNTIVGNSAGNGLYGDNNVILGSSALSHRGGEDTSINRNVVIGDNAGDYIVGNDSILIGYLAGTRYGRNTDSHDNIAIGSYAGAGTGSSGTYNIYLGNNAGYNVKGYYNTIIGFEAKHDGQNETYKAPNGSYNTALGYHAMFNASDTQSDDGLLYNTAIGYRAGTGSSAGSYQNGSYNTFVGASAGEYQTGGGNTYLGGGAGYGSTVSGDNNVAIGEGAARSKGTGNENVIIGHVAGEKLTGEENVVIGHSVGVSKTWNYVTALGYGACSNVNGGDYKTCIGYNSGPSSSSSSSTHEVWLGSSSATVHIPGTLDAPNFSETSDKRLKNIGKPFEDGLEKIRQLKVYNFTFKKDEEKTPRVGVIAQDLEKIFPDAVTKDEDGYLRIRKDDMFYALINAVKQLDLMVQGLIGELKTALYKLSVHDTEIKKLQKENEELKIRIEKLEKLIQ